MPTVDLRHGDCLDVLKTLPDESVHAVITDPPYGLANTDSAHVVETLSRWFAGERDYLPSGAGFMGKAWDAFVPPPAVWDECYRVLKPGGHLLAFAGTRTVDLMGLSIRLAGFDLRDTIAWLSGSGFPKGGDLGKKASEWAGWSTQLKPANEPCLMARKPPQGGVLVNVLAHGTGALNIAATRVGTTVETWPASRSYGTKGKKFDTGEVQQASTQVTGDVPAGRWPSNVVLSHASTPDGGDACAEGCVEGCPVATLDQQSGVSSSTGGFSASTGAFGKHGTYGTAAGIVDAGRTSTGFGDTGGASRFFPVFRYQAKAPTRERPTYVDEHGVKQAHATVKPLALMQWLVRLVTPPGGTVLEPFAGSGTTVEAALLEGFDVIGIEREADYLPLIQQRIDRATTATTPAPAPEMDALW